MKEDEIVIICSVAFLISIIAVWLRINVEGFSWGLILNGFISYLIILMLVFMFILIRDWLHHKLIRRKND